MERNAMKNAARHARRVDRLGPDACCVLCGEPELAALTTVKRRLLEQHHPIPKTYAKKPRVPVCQNCHHKEEERSRQVGVEPDPPPSVPERVISVLLALGAFFVSLGQACTRWAERLAEFLARLTLHFPDWREKVAS